MAKYEASKYVLNRAQYEDKKDLQNKAPYQGNMVRVVSSFLNIQDIMLLRHLL